MTNKLDGIKPGDRVRVTFEGFVLCPHLTGFSPDHVGISLDGSHAGECSILRGRQIEAPTFHIERIEKPLGVGDRVKVFGVEGVYEVVASPRIRYDGKHEVALWSEETGYTQAVTDDLERIP